MGKEAAAFVSPVKAHCGRVEVPFCSRWSNAYISACLVHYTLLIADHCCKGAFEAVARTHA